MPTPDRPGHFVSQDEREFPGISSDEVAKIRAAQAAIRKDTYAVFARHAKIVTADGAMIELEVQLSEMEANRLEQQMFALFEAAVRAETLRGLTERRFFQGERWALDHFARHKIRFVVWPNGKDFASSETFNVKVEGAFEIPDRPELGVSKYSTDGVWIRDQFLEFHPGFGRMILETAARPRS